MNATYIRIDLSRQLRSGATIAFVFLMPLFMYLLFGANASYGDYVQGHANLRFYVMVSMAAYGAVAAASDIAAEAAVEGMQGWGRQLALTRQPAAGFVANKVAVATLVALVAQGLVFAGGAATGAWADSAGVWVSAFLISLAGGAMFAIFGLAIGLLARPESASGLASGSLVFLAFLGNVFTPLDGVMLQIAHWTPMYGYISLVRWPQLAGELVQDGPGNPGRDSLAVLLANLLVWLAIFCGAAIAGTRRARTRR